ncbi:MAG TPA: C-type lectin domain-containing protein [Polyangiaceae bacterium]|nr:C-type lectin domain-containing protein [Polyangiaceae bacterium]
MMRRVFLLVLSVGCTQDFGVFDPAGDAAADAGLDAPIPSEAGPDASADAATDATPPADASTDVTTDSGVPCTETGALQLGGHCYFLVTAAANEQMAQTTCAGTGAHLVTLTQTSEQTAVQALGTGTERWIGLFRKNGAPTDPSYAWITNEPRAGFADWSPGEPNGSGQCVRLLATNLWADDNCATTHPFICERE